MSDYIVRATAGNGSIRAFAIGSYWFCGNLLADSLVSANMVALTIRSFFSPRM